MKNPARCEMRRPMKCSRFSIRRTADGVDTLMRVFRTPNAVCVNRTPGLVKLRQKLVGSDKVEVTETEEKISVDLEKLSPIPLVIFELASPEFGSERALGVCDC
jgi:hypothetical protein